MKTGARITVILFIALLFLCTVTNGNEEILAAHNAFRSEVGVDPLMYNTSLAASAQAWAEHDAGIGSLDHSDPEGNYGENIARWQGASWTDIVDLWGAEQSYFLFGPFGDTSSTTGHWYDIGHYTQIIWNTTTQIGCGKAANITQDAEYFVCRYYPPGNYLGRYPYLQIAEKPTAGIYKDGSWYIDLNGNGVWDAGDQNYGFGAPLWTPVIGDWNNDGLTEIGVYRDGAWYLDYDASGWWSTGDKNFGYGAPDWTPVVGDWNGDGYDKAGAYKDGAWYLDYDGSGTWNAGDRNYVFGGAGWTPVIGKWTEETTNIGVFKDGIYYIDYTGDGAFGAGDKVIVYGNTGSIAVTGDWNANSLTEVGTKNGNSWVLDYDGLGAVNASTRSYTFGAAGWNPVIGDWNGDGNDKSGIYRDGAWYLDYNGNGVWDNGDKNFAFGTTGWRPVIGKWS